MTHNAARAPPHTLCIWTLAGEGLRDVLPDAPAPPVEEENEREQYQRTAAVTSSVMVAAVDNAPLVSFAWLARRLAIAALPALSICSRASAPGLRSAICAPGVDAALNAGGPDAATRDEL